ncbi:MAG: class I SAM-dependent methyltransferase [Desulfobacteraceae bacterium]
MALKNHQKEAIEGIEKVREYAEHHRKHTNLMYRGMLKTIRKLNPGGRCLEVGAGPGFLSMMIAEQLPELHITALDLSPDMKTVAEEFIREKNLESRITYLTADAADPRLQEKLGAFDLVCTAFSLHHWKRPEEAVTNLWGMVRPGGALCILDFRRIGWLCSLPIKWHELESMKEAYKTGELKALLQKAGISKIRVKKPFPFLFHIVTAVK